MSIKKYFLKILGRIRCEATIDDLIRNGMTVGKNLSKQEKVIIDQSHCWLINIGDDVTLAPRVHILAHDAGTKKTLNYTKVGIVNIGNNVFVGASTTVLPGVTIGNDVVIGANSVVNKDIPSNSVAVGNPVKVITTYDEYIKSNREKLETFPKFSKEYTLRNENFNNKMKLEMKEKLIKNGGVGYVE